MEQPMSFAIERLGECTVPSPMKGMRFTGDEEHVLLHSDMNEIQLYLDAGVEPPRFEAAGCREKIYFDPAQLRCGIVTCGGLCPGLNDVIRSIVLSLHHHYGVQTIYGFPYGYEGLAPRFGHNPVLLYPGSRNQYPGDGRHNAWFVSRESRRCRDGGYA